MADTLDNIDIPANTWIDLYANSIIIAGGILVGDQLLIQNIGSADVLINAGAVMPTSTSGYKEIPPSAQAINETGDTGAWVFGGIFGSRVNAGAL